MNLAERDSGLLVAREELVHLDEIEELAAIERERWVEGWSRVTGPTAAAPTTYELGIFTTGTGSGAAAAEFRAGAARPMSILEMGLFLNAATATTLALGRPGNTPAGGTAQTATLPSNLMPSGGASAGGIILSGWGTAPTAPSAGNTMRMWQSGATQGAGIVWTWDQGEMIVSPTTSSGLVLWNLAANAQMRMYLKWIE